MELSELRKRIDRIDAELIHLFAQRMEVSAEIAAYKRANGLPVLDKSREQEKLSRVESDAPPEIREETKILFSYLMELSRSYQNRILQKESGIGQKKIALLGRKLSHSYSSELHELLGCDYSYSCVELESEELGTFLSSNDYDGMNVTIPYKKEILPYLTGLFETAERLGSVNTVLRRGNEYFGDNTDYCGFSYMLKKSGAAVHGKKVLILGSGGVCPTVKAVLADAGAGEIVVISHKDNCPEILREHSDAEILVNTTPVGMYPHNMETPVSLDFFPKLICVLDLIYNPFETMLLREARQHGITGISGISMLTAQAKRAAELFSGKKIPDEQIEDVTAKLIKKKRNLILIGMPGCGKTTLGKLLANTLGREFVDLDEEIEKTVGKPIPQIFSEDGEAAFRETEHRIACKICARSGLVIAAGGGVVTRDDNLAPMEQNGVLIFIEREVKNLATDGRPLSISRTPQTLYEERLPLYRLFADETVSNCGTPKDTLKQLLHIAENSGKFI